jgi:hypothetical protein
MTTLTLDPIVVDAARRLSIPRLNPADSFVLHAPLELMARVGLLPYIESNVRTEALDRIANLAKAYEATGPAEAAAALDEASRAGDLSGVDAIAVWLSTRCSHHDLRQLLGESIVDSLAAAGHVPIGFHLLGRVAGGLLPSSLLRNPLRELARNGDWRLTWFRQLERTNAKTSLAEALAAIAHLGRPGSDFIYPLMSQAEKSGSAPRLIGPALDATDWHSLSRAAAWSMLHDDPSQAPYGWSHCLTMPQGVLSLAGDGVDRRTALAVAATFVVGFRAAHGIRPLGDLSDGAASSTVDIDVASIAGFAILHQDAHLVKYTLACLHAADADPAWRSMYLRAAVYLANWWRQQR